MNKTAKTLDDWSKLGFRVIKGSKHVKRNKNGVCLFTEDQVWTPDIAPDGSSAWDEDREETVDMCNETVGDMFFGQNL